MSSKAAAFLDHLHQLPTIPRVVHELLESFDRDDATIESIAALIATDPVITAKVLRLSNSAFYRRPRSTSSISEAVMFIGLHATRTVVLGAAMVGSIYCPPGFARDAFWRYCLHTGAAARHFALAAHEDADTAFTVGLIHAIGEPLIYTQQAARMKTVDAQTRFADDSRPAVETAALGLCFSDVGAELAERWRFPEAMVTAIRDCRRPADAEPFAALSGLVWLGSRLAALDEATGAALMQQPGVPAMLKRLHLPEAVVSGVPPMSELAAGLDDLVR